MDNIGYPKIFKYQKWFIVDSEVSVPLLASFLGRENVGNNIEILKSIQK